MRRFPFYLVLLLILGCSGNKELKTSPASRIIPNEFAEGFTISAFENGVFFLELTASDQQFLLVPEDADIPETGTDAVVIRTPIRRLVCTSTTHIPMLDNLEEEESLVGFPTLDYISSESVRKRIDDGHVADLGVDQSINIEMLIELSPDLVTAYTLNGPNQPLQKVESLGIPVLYINEYLETHPLGRAEWIRVAGLLYNKLDLADSIYESIANRYKEIQQTAKLFSTLPSAFSGVIYGDSWFMPGGRNYAAQLFSDAAILYTYADDTTSGFLELSVESVLEKSKDADLWIGVADFESLSQLHASDNRYTFFQAFQDKRVYTYNALKGAQGGSVFLELGYLRPDLILSDLVQIAHPEAMVADSLYFHAKLPE